MTDKEIAQTILAQLGGHKFVVMTGAHSFSSGNRQLSMRVNGNGKHGRVRGVVITLDANDTYSMKALDMVKFDVVERFNESGIYCDNLQDFFTEATGLYTSLGNTGETQ